MIFSNNWLREWVDPELAIADFVELLTMAGLEVDDVSRVASGFTNVIVGLVESVSPHPSADKLKVCQVSDGEERYQVVCGAPNVSVGVKVPFAKLGAVLALDKQKSVEIKLVNLRGVDSSGMLCSGEELGIGDDSSGLLLLPESYEIGVDLQEAMELNDISVSLDLTPNRGDCLSIRGLAREVSALTRKEPKSPIGEQNLLLTSDKVVKVEIFDGAACPLYMGRVICGIDSNIKTPMWIKEKLRRCGLRSIDPIVDVTNYVLLELGQPLHAFDLDKLGNSVHVRKAFSDESLVLLDGKNVKLNEETLVIANDEEALAIAGVMGGLSTAVDDQTSNVFLECAFFSPVAIVGKARAYGLHTDASHRYERGVDYRLQTLALERATDLLQSIVGGNIGPVTIAQKELPIEREINLSFLNVERLLGVKIDHDEIVSILSRLGMPASKLTNESITVTSPSYRFDLEIEADLIEEIARVHGYNSLPKTPTFNTQKFVTNPEAILSDTRIKEHLAARGFHEVINYSFIDPTLSRLFASEESALRLKNPISEDMSTMRTSLMPGLLMTLKYNMNRQRERVQLFESGVVFKKTDNGVAQPAMIAGVVAGPRNPKSWTNGKDLFDFFDLKGHVESLLGLTGNVEEFEFLLQTHCSLHEGQCASVMRNNDVIGFMGRVDPRLARELDIPPLTFLFELTLSELRSGNLTKVSVLSKFPEVNRDLSIVVAEDISAAAITDCLSEQAKELLVDVAIVDLYRSEAIGEGGKSIAISLTLQHHSRTLDDEEVNVIISKCINELEIRFKAKLRH
jgi:phenylalanyl-tRNA synthetase beta chain